MDTQTLDPTVAAVPAPVAPWTTYLAAAITADHATDPDTTPLRIRAAYRDLSCAGSGPQVYRRVIYPGQREACWPDSPRLPAAGSRASERRCVVHADVPAGTILIDYEQDVYRGRRGRASVTIGIVCALRGGAEIIWLTHRTLRSRPVYEVTTPARGAIEIARREV